MPSNRRPPSRIAVSRFSRSSALTLRWRCPLASSSPSVVGRPVGGTGGWLTPAPYVWPVAGAQHPGVDRGNAAACSAGAAASGVPTSPGGAARRGWSNPWGAGSPAGGDRPGRPGRDAHVVHDVVDDVVNDDLEVSGHLERHGGHGRRPCP